MKTLASVLILVGLFGPCAFAQECVDCNVANAKSQTADQIVATATQTFPEAVSKAVDFSKRPDAFYCQPDGTQTRHRYDGAYDVAIPCTKPECRDVAGIKEENLDYTTPIGFTLSQDNAGGSHKGVDPTDPDFSDDETPERRWYFDFKDRNTESTLIIDDVPIIEVKNPRTGKVVDSYQNRDADTESYTIYNFFPRKVVPSVVKTDSKLIATLPTGEKIEYDAATRKVTGGVFVETPRADLGVQKYTPGVDIQTKHPGLIRNSFPDSTVAYQGKGVWIETKVTNSTGQRSDPATKVVIHNGSVDPNCTAGKDCSECTVGSDKVNTRTFGQRYADSLNSSYVCYQSAFKTDDDFNQFLKANCKFSLPKL